MKNDNIMIIDDDESITTLLEHKLRNNGYNTVAVNNGMKAIELLRENPDKFSVILLDRVMPGMNGIEVLKWMKKHPRLQSVPVIMETVSTEQDNILEGLREGAFYYLTKPYKTEMLLHIVKTAYNDFHRYNSVYQELVKNNRVIGQIKSAEFVFKTIDEGLNITYLLAGVSPNSESIAYGLSELIINAVEHGNLGITYQEKTELLEKEELKNEINRRYEVEEYKDKRVTIYYQKTDEKDGNKIYISIKDEGNGFDWEKYLELNTDKVFEAHGRGIFMSNMVFDEMKYIGNGNQVVVTIAGKKD